MLTCSEVWLLPEPVDMRKGIDALTLIAHQADSQFWQNGGVFLFRNRLGDRIRVLHWDKHGVWACHRRLHQGRFIWPAVTDATWTLTQAQFDWLVIGVDWRRLSAPQRNWQIF